MLEFLNWNKKNLIYKLNYLIPKDNLKQDWESMKKMLNLVDWLEYKEILLILEVQNMEEVQFNNIQFKVLIIHQLEWFNLNTELLKKQVKRNKQEMIEEEQLQEHMDLLIQDIQDQVQQNKYPHIKHMKEAQVDIVEQHNNQEDIVEFLNLQDNLD